MHASHSFPHFAIVALLLATNSHALGVQFDYPDFNTGGGAFRQQGAAYWTPGQIRLANDGWMPNANAGYNRGSLWYNDKLDLTNGFDTTFCFRIKDRWGDGVDGGMAFVVQNNYSQMLGDPGWELGYGGSYISNGLAVEMDIADQNPLPPQPDWDTGGNHIAIHTGATGPLYATTPPKISRPADLMGTHLMNIQYTPGLMNVYLDGSQVVSYGVNLANTLRLDNGKAYLGFTAAAGGWGADIDLLSWSYSSRTSTSPPSFEPGLTFNPTPTPKAGAKKLIVIVHGINDGPSISTWQSDMKDAIEARIQRDGGKLSDYDIWIFDWSTDAGETIQDIPGHPPSGHTMRNAYGQGQYLASRILASGQYDQVQLIGHSMGGRVIDTATNFIKDTKPSIKIQETFLDAYTRVLDSAPPFNMLSNQAPWENQFGSKADFAEHYVNNANYGGDYPGTDQTITNAYNVDITNVRPDTDKSLNGHSWPIRWYIESIRGTLGDDAKTLDGKSYFGFATSEAAGNRAWQTGSPADTLQPGYRVYLNSEIALRSVSNPGSRPGYTNVQSISPITDKTSDGGSVVVDTAGNKIQISTHSPAWANFNLHLNNPANALAFNYQFLSPDALADGLLTIYINDQPIAFLYERFLDDSAHWSDWLYFDSEVAPGDYILSFRLDPLTSVQSTISLSNIEVGYSEIPEPASLALLALGCLALPFRRAHRSGLARKDRR
jgi:hypothetical protein